MLQKQTNNKQKTCGVNVMRFTVGLSSFWNFHTDTALHSESVVTCPLSPSPVPCIPAQSELQDSDGVSLELAQG